MDDGKHFDMTCRHCQGIFWATLWAGRGYQGYVI